MLNSQSFCTKKAQVVIIFFLLYYFCVCAPVCVHVCAYGMCVPVHMYMRV